jgi:hypothetical protein
MNRITTISGILMMLFLGIHFVFAQGNDEKNGTTAAQFLKIGVGARPMAMGGAYVGLSDDVYSLYWNPAGISKLQKFSLGGTYTRWFADITHHFWGLVLPVNQNIAVGVYGVFLNMDPIQVTTIDRPHGTGEFFEASDLAIGFSFAARPVDFLSIGVSGKFIQQSIYNESASALAFDIGSLLDIPFKGMKLGMNFSNLGGKMKLDGRDLTREYDLNPDNTLNTGVETRLRTQDWDLPVNFRVGLAMEILGGDKASFYRSENNRLSFTVDGNHPADAAEYLAFGLEYTFSNIISLRGGYRLNRDVEKFYYGMGLTIPLADHSNFRFDYALASFGELDYIHMFGGSISL